MVRQVVDLSHKIQSQMMVFPGDPQVQICKACSILEHGFEVSAVQFGTHTGTHLDAPSHLLSDKKTISDYVVSDFIARGFVMDFSSKQCNEAITITDIQVYLQGIQAGDFILIYTGFDQFFGQAKYLEHPFLHEQAAKVLLDLGVKGILMDTLSVDSHLSEEFLTHKTILEQNALIGENFCNLKAINFSNPIISILPLNFHQLDGSPIRAVAMQI